MNIAELDTPAALLDEAVLHRNVKRMQQRMKDLGVRFRPHVKTAKCLEVAGLQRKAGAAGITVSTLKEAEEFFAGGFDDILYAVCVSPQKRAKVQDLRRRGCRLTVLLDSVAAAESLTAGGEAFDVMIEVDTDGHRSGVSAESDLLLQIAGVLRQGGCQLVGVMTHAGASYELHDVASLEAMAEQERSLCVRAAERLKEAGFACPEVSVGSTPTALFARHLEGVTEVRAGVYAFNDLVMKNIGVCEVEDLALSVLTTVIGHQEEKGWVILDAGWMAMSRDRGTSSQDTDFGYGLVCDETRRPIPDTFFGDANQEHGIIEIRDSHEGISLAKRFPLGTRLRILPNHACSTAAQFPGYHIVDGEVVRDKWRRFVGW